MGENNTYEQRDKLLEKAAKSMPEIKKVKKEVAELNLRIGNCERSMEKISTNDLPHIQKSLEPLNLENRNSLLSMKFKMQNEKYKWSMWAMGLGFSILAILSRL